MSKILEKPKDAGRSIAARRAYLNKSGMDIENATKGILYQKMLSELETGKKPIDKLRVNQLIALMAQLEWTPDEFKEATGLELPTVTLDSVLPHLRVEHSSVLIPTYHLTVSNGKGEAVATTRQVSVDANWSGQYEAYILLETETHVQYVVVEFRDEYVFGDELVIAHPQKGVIHGTFEAKVADTLVVKGQHQTFTLLAKDAKGKTGVVVRNARDRK